MKPNPFELQSIASVKYHACKLAYASLESIKNDLDAYHRKDEALMIHELQKGIKLRAEQITING